MTKEKDSEIENDLKKETHSEMESLDDEKNKLKKISLEKVSHRVTYLFLFRGAARVGILK